MPVYENERGTYIFNSKDLNMIEYIDQILDAGIDSLKIEGRMKTALYVATVARTYRKAIDDCKESVEKYRANTTKKRSQNAHTVSLQQDSILERQTKLPRYMTAIRILRTAHTSESFRDIMTKDMHS